MEDKELKNDISNKSESITPDLAPAKHIKLRRFFYGFGIFISLLMLLCCTLICCSSIWLTTTWGDTLSFDSIIFQLKSPMKGTGNGMIGAYILKAAVPTFLLFIAAVLIYILFVGRYRRKNPGTKKAKNRYIITLSLTLITSVAMFTTGFITLWYKAGLGEYLKNINTESPFIESSYVDPAETELTFPEKKKNVIYIFLESVEMTFTDKENGGAWDSNLIPNLTQLNLDGIGEDFSGNEPGLNGGYSLWGTSWTMGAMFAQTSGLPLKISIDGNSMDTQDSFFPTITTFGDILQQNGYKNVLAFGSDAEFGGRKAYFSSHGNYEIHDYYYAKNNGLIPSNYFVFWGFEDQKLFDFAKKDLTELASGDQPFNYTMLTVDTHFEDGYVCPLCQKEHSIQYENVYSCSDRQVTEFVKWCQTQDWYENTTIVLCGDHPTMDKDFCTDLSGNYLRRVYTSVINSAVQNPDPDRKRVFSTFDMFPTTLAAMGVKIEGNRLGLGTNLYSKEATLTELYGRDEEQENLKMHSEFMDRISNVDANSSKMLERQDKYLHRAKVALVIDDSLDLIYTRKKSEDSTEATNTDSAKNNTVWNDGSEPLPFDTDEINKISDTYNPDLKKHTISAVFTNTDKFDENYIDKVILKITYADGESIEKEMSIKNNYFDEIRYLIYDTEISHDEMQGSLTMQMTIISRSGAEITQSNWIRKAEPTKHK
ncbi:MAG: sulfatase-like hydrolase/transferase [Eubacterium sp.]|nr:sulfatase-like hydrolase/transferase [Eubacterium sp.]